MTNALKEKPYEEKPNCTHLKAEKNQKRKRKKQKMQFTAKCRKKP
jgi:hypothetical protein